MDCRIAKNHVGSRLNPKVRSNVNMKAEKQKIVFTEEETKDLNNSLLLMYQLSLLQENICADIGRIFRSKGALVFEIKHTHKMIKKLILDNHKSFLSNLSQEQIDVICEDADDLEKVVNKWAGINDKIL